MNLYPLRSRAGSTLGAIAGAAALALSGPLHAQNAASAPAAPVAAPAAATGTVTGAVLEPESGRYLNGADVSVSGTSLHTTTDRGGVFVLSNVPAGAQQLVVAYPGLPAKTVSINVTGGASINQPVSLGSDIVQLSTFTVESAKEGMAAAIAQQKASPNEKIVEASDQFGDISEGNAAEYLKFLPGVNVEWNANDARALGLRGLPTYFTNITFSGNPLASASSANTNRRFEFEQVSLNDISTVEIQKGMTPDQQATSTAGSVNFVPKSAFDREGSLLVYRGYLTAASTAFDLFQKEPSYSDSKTMKTWPAGLIDYETKVNDKFGFDVNASLSQIYNQYPRSQYDWTTNPAVGATPANPYPLTWETILEEKLTKREQLSGTFDYRPNAQTKIQAAVGWSWYWLVFQDREEQWSIGSLAALPAGVTTPSYAGTDAVTSQVGKGAINQIVSIRWKQGTTYYGDLPIEEKMLSDRLVLTATPYWTQSYSKYRDSSYGAVAEVDGTVAGITTTLGHIGITDPSISATYNAPANTSPVDPNNLGGYSVSQVRLRPQTGYDTQDGVPVNLKYDFDTVIPVSLTAGVRYDNHIRQDMNIASTLKPTATTNPPALTGAGIVALKDNIFSGQKTGYGIQPFNWLSPYKALGAYPVTAIPPVAASSDTFAIWNEYTRAAYLRLDMTLWNKLLIIAGARLEDHTIDSYNRIATPQFNNGFGARLTDDHVYPSLNLKYNVTKDWDFRASFSKTLGLPDYNNLLPSGPTVTPPNASTPTGTISIFNPGLKPYGIYNYDLTTEYYVNPSGFFSAALFHKIFHNYIVSFSQQLSPALAAQYGVPLDTGGATVQGFPLAQYNVTSAQNINDSTATWDGVELAYNQTLTFLPKPFNTVGVQANYTRVLINGVHTHQPLTNSSAANNAVLQQQANQALFLDAVTQEANLAVNGTFGRFNFIVTENYTGRYLTSDSVGTVQWAGAGANSYLQKIEYAPRSLTDVTVEFKAMQRFVPYFTVHNVFNRPIYNTFDGHPELHSEFGDPLWEIGFRGVW